MDLILYNGKISTMDKSNPEVSAVAVKDGLIADVGTDEAMLKLKTDKTKVIDLKQKRMVPGLNDSHLHNVKYGVYSSCCDLSETRSIGQLKDAMKKFIADNKIEKGKWVGGRGWNQDYFDVKVFPELKDLDEVSKDHPILIYRACGHVVVVNSKALEVLGIDENTPPLEDGEFSVKTGAFKEYATGLVEVAMKQFGMEELKNYIIKSCEDLLKQGITSIQSDDFKACPNYDMVIKAYSELAREGKLPVRVYQQCLFADTDEVNEFLANEKNYNIADVKDFYELGPIKILADGSLGARTAYLTRPYNDDPSTTGIPIYSQEQLDSMVQVSHDAGKSVAIHCIGDKTAYMAMESIEKAQKKNPRSEARHGIVHCQIEDIPLLNKYKELNVVGYIQPIFLHYDMHILEDRVGKELAATSYNFGRMRELGVHASMGTDSPVEKFDTLPNIYCAVTRKDMSGYPEGGFYPDQCMTVEDAVYCYTVESAYCSYLEDKKGSIQKGKFADFTVFGDDIMTIDPMKIKDSSIAMTIVNGNVSYEA